MKYTCGDCKHCGRINNYSGYCHPEADGKYLVWLCQLTCGDFELRAPVGITLSDEAQMLNVKEA